MKNNDVNTVENNVEEVKNKKKQKATMAIRPSDYLESKFKEEAANKGLSQTQLFERVFSDYLHMASSEYRNRNLDCSLELQAIDGATKTLKTSLQQIVAKSQSKLALKDREFASLKESTDRQIELATLELNNDVAELKAKNKALEEQLAKCTTIINGFDTVKENLENEIRDLKECLESKDRKIECHLENIKKRDKSIKDLEREKTNAAKELYNAGKELALSKQENEKLERELSSVRASNQMLQENINTFSSMKAVEIKAIKENVETISTLKLNSIEVTKNLEIENLNSVISSLKDTLNSKDVEISSLKSTVQTLEVSKASELETLRDAVATLNSTIEIKVNENEELKKSLSAKAKTSRKKKEETE